MVLLRAEKYRTITMELMILVLKELVYTEDSEPKLKSEYLNHLEIAYTMALSDLKCRLLHSEVGDSFLELFESEITNFEAVRFDHLVTDFHTLLPIAEKARRDVSFTMRMPSGEIEEARKSIHRYILSRDLRISLSDFRPETEFFKLEESENKLKEPEKDDLIQWNDEDCTIVSYVVSMNGVGDRILLIRSPILVVVRVPNLEEKGVSVCREGFVQDVLDLRNIEVAVSNGVDKKILLTMAGSFEFKTEELAIFAKESIQKARQEIRNTKLKKLYRNLGINQEDAQHITHKKVDPVIASVEKPIPHEPRSSRHSPEREEES